jgi:hypothetical protein
MADKKLERKLAVALICKALIAIKIKAKREARCL